jgi:hypothetical protein
VTLLVALVLTVSGCGGSKSSPTALRLQREDLVAVARALQSAEASVRAEVAATKAAWPLVVNGLPAVSTGVRAPIHQAATRAAQIVIPAALQEDQAGALTGPAATVGGLFHSFAGLVTHGWELIDGAAAQIERGPHAVARFARANVALYIESVYDGHFSLAQVGKKLLTGYRKLGGPSAFGAALTQAEARALAHTYSEAGDRLHPHPGVKLGS